MDTWQFWSDILTAWAWPVAVIVVALIFRKQVATLLGTLKSLEAGGLKAVFADRVAEVQVAIESQPRPKDQLADQPKDQQTKDSLPKTLTADEITKPGYAAQRVRWFIRRNTERPSAIVLSAWDRLASVLTKVFSPKLDSGINSYSLGALAEDKVSPTFLFHVGELLALRNKVSHSPDFEPTLESARAYEESAENLIRMALGHKAGVSGP